MTTNEAMANHTALNFADVGPATDIPSEQEYTDTNKLIHSNVNSPTAM
jgi:hypothetical protein